MEIPINARRNARINQYQSRINVRRKAKNSFNQQLRKQYHPQFLLNSMKELKDSDNPLIIINSYSKNPHEVIVKISLRHQY